MVVRTVQNKSNLEEEILSVSTKVYLMEGKKVSACSSALYRKGVKAAAQLPCRKDPILLATITRLGIMFLPICL
jgi:hypothetical protein